MALELHDIRRGIAQARISGCTHYRWASSSCIQFFDANERLKLVVSQQRGLWVGDISFLDSYDSVQLSPIQRLMDRYGSQHNKY